MARTAQQTTSRQTDSALNRGLARAALQALIDAGVCEFIVCPGARNAPLIEWLSASPALLRSSFPDERSAAFFALGRCKSSFRPVAVITSSGTAAAELLPAVIEAHYSQLPLVLVTADRPESFRLSGAPQSIIQPGLYGPYVEDSHDWHCAADVTPLQLRNTPLHLNLCFEEPRPLGPLPVLHPAPSPRNGLESLWGRPCLEEIGRAEAFLQTCQNPLILLGELPPALADKAAPLIASLPGHIYAEAQSNLGRPQLGERVLRSGERLLRQRPLAFDGVLRIGGVPTTRLWRDMEQELADLPVLSAASSPYAGLGRAEQPPISLASLQTAVDSLGPQTDADPRLLQHDRNLQQQLHASLDQHPHSELALMQALYRRIPSGARVFLGNSQPIRHWDQVSAGEARHEVHTNRGANGIDGLISTGLGLASAGRETWIIVGDLSAMYDLQALWAVDRDWPLRIVVINNQGGRIFEPMFDDPSFINRHQLNFRGWAQMFQLDYQRVQHPEDCVFRAGAQIIELKPDNQASARCREALA